MTTITATGEKNNKSWKAKGHSSRGVQIGRILRDIQDYNSEAREFLAYLSHLAKNPVINRSPFSCAEPHAVALLLKAGCTLSSIEFPLYAKGQYGDIDACGNCSSWLYNGSVAIPEYQLNKLYTFNDYDQESNLSNVKPIKKIHVNYNDKNEFPSLPNSNNNTNNISASIWKKFKKDFN